MVNTRYIIIIGDDEELGFVTKEIQEGTLTVMITARTWEEAQELRQGIRYETEN